MNSDMVFEKLPNSTQNPLLATDTLYKYCKPRFRWISTKNSFVEWLESRVERGLIRAAYHHSGVSYFSAFQIWQINELDQGNPQSEQSANSTEFEALLHLLTRIQDFYLPEVRSDQRFGEYYDYCGKAAIGGTYFCGKTWYMLAAVRKWRQHNIESDRFDPAQALSVTGLDARVLRHWIARFTAIAEHIDPLSNWRMLVRCFRHSKRQQLKFEALLAQDFYEMAELLTLFLVDLGSSVDTGDPTEHSYKTPQWKIERYGDSLSRPYEMLEFLSNEYGLNPKPRAIVFTEGQEWRAVEKLYAYYGYSPELLGIEFRSIEGEGNFSLRHWRFFIEYMHEKQTLIYFLLDKEGEVVKQATKLLDKNRIFSFAGLERIIPSRDRICIWRQSFEESNFTDAEIRRALACQGVKASSQKVAAVRTGARKKGLISALSGELGVDINKPRLSVDLADELVSRRRKRPGVKSLRPIERFVKQSGRLIMLNHQPADQEIQRLNIETGLLG